MQPESYCLTALSLKFCFLNFFQLKRLADALRENTTLVKLDLSNNGLESGAARFVVKALHENETLSDVDFHGNQLDDVFAEALAGLLESNEILHRVDIS